MARKQADPVPAPDDAPPAEASVTSPDEGATTAAHAGRADEALVPAWLALLVLVLIVAVVGVGGFVIRGMLADGGGQTSAQNAVERYSAEAAAKPNDVDAMLNLAFALQQDKKYTEAMAEYAKVLAVDPKNTAALYNEGVIYMTQGQGKKGEAVLWKVLAIDPKHALAATELGTYYGSKGHYKSMLAAVKPVADARPTIADLQALVGMAYEKLGERDQAIDYYRRALKYTPDLQDAIDGLARLGASAQ